MSMKGFISWSNLICYKKNANESAYKFSMWNSVLPYLARPLSKIVLHGYAIRHKANKEIMVVPLQVEKFCKWYPILQYKKYVAQKSRFFKILLVSCTKSGAIWNIQDIYFVVYIALAILFCELTD